MGREPIKSLAIPKPSTRRLFDSITNGKPASRNIESTGTEPDEETTAKAASITLEEAEEQAWYEVDQYLRGINPYEYQEIVASLLRAMGYHVS
jgi:restriction system protein